MQARPSSMAILGDRQSGQDVRTQNVMAAMVIANTVKSALGPVGLDKMLVDDIGDVTISNDGATILKLLEVEHPAAKVLVELADLQDQEVGDGTTSVVIVAAELLKRANELVKAKIHPTTIITGYRIAVREAIKFIHDKLQIEVSSLGRDALLNVARTSLASKIVSTDIEFFSSMVVDAMLRVKTVNSKGDFRYPLKSVNILKAMGKSAKESQFVKGFALNCTVAAQQMPKKITNAKVAILDINLNKARLPLGVQIVVSDPKKMEEIRQREANLIKEKIQLILKAGANVILTSKGIDDMCLKYFVEAGAMGVRRVKKEDLKRIAKATGGQLVTSMSNLEGNEEFDPSWLGTCGTVVQERVADDELLLFLDTKNTRTSSIILRGANTLMLDEMERSLHDALSIVKRTLESNAVVPGGGSVETALSVYLEKFALSLSSREQVAVQEFAEALLIIPKTLCVNAAQDATELVAQLRSYHSAADPSEASKKEYFLYGLDLFNGKVRNNFEAGVLEPAVSKVKSIKFAVEAAITILRIDDMIKLDPKPQEGEEH